MEPSSSTCCEHGDGSGWGAGPGSRRAARAEAGRRDVAAAAGGLRAQAGCSPPHAGVLPRDTRGRDGRPAGRTARWPAVPRWAARSGPLVLAAPCAAPRLDQLGGGSSPARAREIAARPARRQARRGRALGWPRAGRAAGCAGRWREGAGGPLAACGRRRVLRQGHPGAQACVRRAARRQARMHVLCQRAGKGKEGGRVTSPAQHHRAGVKASTSGVSLGRSREWATPV
jgi:hypothetical protein